MVVAEVCSSMKYPKRCQYKHAKQKKYHVRNWAEYNEGLRRRGDLTVWFDEEAIANWNLRRPGFANGQVSAGRSISVTRSSLSSTLGCAARRVRSACARTSSSRIAGASRRNSWRRCYGGCLLASTKRR